MSNEFSSLNGYNVKDATARASLENKVENSLFTSEINRLSTDISNNANNINNLNTRFNSFSETISNNANTIVYDNSSSKMVSTNVQDAIDELKDLTGTGELNATKIVYDNSVSGLSSTDIQGAIDETKSNLTASDNVVFRFGKTPEGKYGYVVTDSEGADTVIPFSGNGETLATRNFGGGVNSGETYTVSATANLDANSKYHVTFIGFQACSNMWSANSSMVVDELNCSAPFTKINEQSIIENGGSGDLTGKTITTRSYSATYEISTTEAIAISQSVSDKGGDSGLAPSRLWAYMVVTKL